MNTLACKDLGIMNCTFVASGSTNQAAIDASIAHLMTDHPDKMASMKKTMTEDQINSTMMKAIKGD